MVSRVLSVLLLVLGVLGLSDARAEVMEPARKLALVAPIRGTIDLGLGPFVERVLRQAKEQRAEVVILDIDTFGGRVDAAVAMRDTLLRSPVKTVADSDTADALAHGVADFEADDLPAVLSALGLSGAELRTETENWAERLVRFLTHPVVSSLLMTLGILGLMVEIRTPGFGLPGVIGALCLVSFFWGHWLVELVGWEQLLLLVVGLALVAVEAFVLPGFGVAGMSDWPGPRPWSRQCLATGPACVAPCSS